MKKLSLLASGAVLALAIQTSSASLNLVGISVPWIEGQTGALARRTDGDTVGGNNGWNAYLRPVGGSFVNSGDGAGLRFDLSLEAGSYSYEVLLQHGSWADNSPNSPGSYLNLFFDGDRANPGISAKLAGGNTGAVAALTTADIDQVRNDLNGLVAPAGSLEYDNGQFSVTLTDMSLVTVGDTVGAFSDLPSGNGEDSLLSFTLNVEAIPEPSTSLLALLGLGFLFRRRR